MSDEWKPQTARLQPANAPLGRCGGQSPHQCDAQLSLLPSVLHKPDPEPEARGRAWLRPAAWFRSCGFLSRTPDSSGAALSCTVASASPRSPAAETPLPAAAAAEMVVFPTERRRSEVGARSRCPARLQDAVLMETLCSAPHVSVRREEFQAASSARHCGCPALVC